MKIVDISKKSLKIEARVRKMISERTPIALGSVAALVGVVLWASNIANGTMNNTKAIEALQIRQEQYNVDLHQIKEALVRIDQQLKE